MQFTRELRKTLRQDLGEERNRKEEKNWREKRLKILYFSILPAQKKKNQRSWKRQIYTLEIRLFFSSAKRSQGGKSQLEATAEREVEKPVHKSCRRKQKNQNSDNCVLEGYSVSSGSSPYSSLLPSLSYLLSPDQAHTHFIRNKYAFTWHYQRQNLKQIALRSSDTHV